MSAIVILKSSTNFTYPTDGFKVVNQQFAILGNARETAAKNVDLPILGNPTSPMSANVFNYKYIIFRCPSLPYLNSYFINGQFWLPFPISPPLAIKYFAKSTSKSVINFFFSIFYIEFSSQCIYISYNNVPHGTLIIVLPPFFPSFPLGPPVPPSLPSIVLLLKWERSYTDLCASTIISPPLPPQPPSGCPFLTLLSAQKEKHPFPPFPATTVSLTWSAKFFVQNFDILPSSTFTV